MVRSSVSRWEGYHVIRYPCPTPDLEMRWRLSWRADPTAKRFADRHYSRQNPDSDQFAPPGRCLVLVTDHAYWVTSWPKAEYVKHAYAGAWLCSAFRREDGDARASDLILQAVAATRFYFGEPPRLGMVTFVDEKKVRHKRDPGRCFLRAGFLSVPSTKGGLLAFALAPSRMPAPAPCIGASLSLAGIA